MTGYLMQVGLNQIPSPARVHPGFSVCSGQVSQRVRLVMPLSGGTIEITERAVVSRGAKWVSVAERIPAPNHPVPLSHEISATGRPATQAFIRKCVWWRPCRVAAALQRAEKSARRAAVITRHRAAEGRSRRMHMTRQYRAEAGRSRGALQRQRLARPRLLTISRMEARA